MGVDGAGANGWGSGRWPARIAVVTPHPDDELWLGGSLALAARAGSEVRLTCMTRGEAGTDYLAGRPGGRLTGQALAAWRVVELRAAAALLGITHAEAWELPDGGLAAVPDADVVGRIADRIAGVDLVLTLGVDGIYGHRDHVATTRWVRLALGALGAQRSTGPAAPEAWGVVFAPGLFDATWASFQRRRPELAVPDWTAARGTPDGDEAVRVAITAVEDRKRAAIRAHRSQLRGSDEAAFFVPGTLPHMLGVERFERLTALAPVSVGGRA